MPGAYSHTGRLSPKQREAARLDASGLSATEIAKRCKVSGQRISAWRADPRYAEHVEMIQREHDRDAIARAATTREAALVVVTGALARAGQAIKAGTVTPSEAATLGRFGLDVYRATSAQTGIEESTRQTIGVTTQWRDAALGIAQATGEAIAAADDGADDAADDG